MMNFSQRSNEKELMDEMHLTQAQWQHIFTSIGWINRYLVRINSFIKPIQILLKNAPSESTPITVADFACGDGQILHKMAIWAKKKSLPLLFFGYDTNPYLLHIAPKNDAALPITLKNQDIMSPKFTQQSFDIITCNFFCHHLSDEQLIIFFKQLHQQARIGVIINDLHRHRLAYAGFYLSYLIKNFSPLARHDGFISIRRGFRKREIISLLQQAGIKHYQVKWHFPFFYRILIFT